MSPHEAGDVPGSVPELPGYEWVRTLGAGGFADVHLYHQQVPSRDVAVKVVRTTQDRYGRDVLAREADAMAVVSGHPAVVALHAVGATADGRPYLVMEHCPVADVGAQVRAHPLAVRRALEVMIPICAGVEMLHRRGVVHRDIKPSNIMLNAFGRPVLGDFGVSLATGSVSRGSDDGFSVLWAPPEQQLSGTPAHPTQDVWALASTMWTLLTGRSPFEDPLGDNSAVAIAARVQEGRLPGLGRADAPAALEEALQRALDTDPRGRTSGAAELGRQLQAVQEAMRLPVTPLELSDGPAGDDATVDGAGTGAGAGLGRGSRGGAPPGADLDEDRTRVRGLPVVDGSRAPARPHSFEFTDPEGRLPGRDAWSAEDGEARTSEEPDLPDVHRRRSPLVIALVVVLAVVAAAGLAVAMLTGGGSTVRPAAPTQTSSPQDPVGSTTTPVSDLQGQERDGRIYWTWRHEGTATGTGTGYFYTATAPGSEPRSGRATLEAVDVVAEPGSNCLEVTAQGEDGRQSTPVSSCVEVP